MKFLHPLNIQYWTARISEFRRFYAKKIYFAEARNIDFALEKEIYLTKRIL